MQQRGSGGGRAGGVGAGANPAGGASAGLPQAQARGRSAQEILEIDWNYPVYKAADGPVSDGRTTAETRMVALTTEKAYSYLAGEDQRPLLVLRECLVCNGTDDALLGAEADNEKTILLSRWFNCVKLPVDAMLDENHPFHKLFDGKNPLHLFVADWNGANFTPLESERSRTQLWDVLSSAIQRNYKKDARKSLKSLAKMLDRYDVVDRQLDELNKKFEQEIENKGPKSRKLVKIKKKIDANKAELAELDKDFAKASQLELVKREAPAVASANNG